MRSIEAHTRDHSLLDSASMGRREYWLWLLASGGTLIDGLSVFSLGIAMPLVTSRFALNPLMVGLIGSALVLGAIFGAVLGGPSADCCGRKPAYLIDVAIIAAGAFVRCTAMGVARPIVGGNWNRHRLSRQRFVRVRDDAQARL